MKFLKESGPKVFNCPKISVSEFQFQISWSSDVSLIFLLLLSPSVPLIFILGGINCLNVFSFDQTIKKISTGLAQVQLMAVVKFTAN